MRIAVAGGTGFLGRPLGEALLRDGHELLLLTRAPSRSAARDVARLRTVAWQPGLPAAQPQLGHGAAQAGIAGAWAEQLDGVDAVINLAGEPIAERRWTAAQKRRIRDSRVNATMALAEAMARLPRKPSVLVNASAVGYYGPHGDEALDESAPAGGGFLAETCRAWEAAALRAESSGVRVVRLRIGVVLARGGGALAKMLPPFRAFLGGPLGSGRQWLSWVHRDDVIGLIRWALTDGRVRGAVNATAPAAATMRDFAAALGRALRRPSWLPTPGFALRLLLGEMSEMLLTGQRVVPAAAQRLGYTFLHPSLHGALTACVGGHRR